MTSETERARMLANQSRDALHHAGLGDPTIDRLADRFVGEDRGEDVETFIRWAVQQGSGRETAQGSATDPDTASEDSFPASDPPPSWATAGGEEPRPPAST